MSQIKVEYIDHMGDDLRISNVARVSFGKWKEEIDEKDVKLIKYLAEHEHNSPFRHVQISVRCKAPVFLARQLVKHCVGLSWNEISRRYVDTDAEFYQPSAWRKRPENGIKQGSGQAMTDKDRDFLVWEQYNISLDAAIEAYDSMLKMGVAPEMARMVLPQSMMVDWVWTGSLEAFYHMYRLRSGEGAQVEAREFAEKLKEVVEPLFPNTWQALVGEK